MKSLQNPTHNTVEKEKDALRGWKERQGSHRHIIGEAVVDLDDPTFTSGTQSKEGIGINDQSANLPDSSKCPASSILPLSRL